MSSKEIDDDIHHLEAVLRHDLAFRGLLKLYRAGAAKNIFQKIFKQMLNTLKKCIFAVPEPAKPLNDAQMCGSFYFYKLKMLLSDFPDVDPAAMGFPQKWEEEPVWK